jgi:hypothetical protein
VAGTWQLQNINHINIIAAGFESTIEHFRDRVGFVLDRKNPDYHGVDFCLMTLGEVMFACFIPNAKAEGGQGRLLARYGNFYNGLEYKVADVADARRLCDEHDVRVIQDRGGVFFTHPGSILGVSFEIFGGDFQEFAQPPGFWEAEHPLRLTGLARLTVAVKDVDVAVDRLQEVTGAPAIAPVARPQAAAQGMQLQVGEAVWELLQPTGEGRLADFLSRYDQRIRSVVWRTRDLSRVEAHLQSQGLSMIPGDADDSLAIDPLQNLNLLFEFTE